MIPSDIYLFDLEDTITSFSEMRIGEETYKHKYCSEYHIVYDTINGAIEDTKIDPRKKVLIYTDRKASGEVMI